MDTSRTPSSVPEHESAPRLISPPGVGARHWQAVMTFFCLLLSYCLRVNLSVAIVAMTDTRDSRPDVTILPWDIAQKGVILSSMFWGYCILQIPAGHLSRIIGPKYLLFWAMVVCSSATILGPFIALQCDWLGFCVSRFVVGLAQGFFFPCVNSHIAKWAPPWRGTGCFHFVFVATLTMFGGRIPGCSKFTGDGLVIFYVNRRGLWDLPLGSDVAVTWGALDDLDSHSTISDGTMTGLNIKYASYSSIPQTRARLYLMIEDPIERIILTTSNQSSGAHTYSNPRVNLELLDS
ncbi:sialin-like [Homalodisca vitripennis]|uniref:sialin-like n=1 Tax=Homalodisca vitripennis TaxID=197043 RepID=UPI001EEC961F|nr:sialin-like [Homalodisca vitripennis]